MSGVLRNVSRMAVIPTLAAVLSGCAAKEGPGLKVTIDLAGTKPASMKVAVSADHGGFAFQMADNSMGVGVTTEDLDGDGALELVAEFVQPDPTVSFRVEAPSQVGLTLTVKARAFNKDDLIAAADGVAPPLPPGGQSTVALQLAPQTGPIGPNTRTTDLGTAAIDVAVSGPKTNVNMSSLAVCDVDNDGAQDIIIGAPADDGLGVGASGAVYIVWGGWDGDTTVDLAQPNGKATIFYGTGTAEHLGASVACADLDGDGAGDIVAGAPGADLGRGRVYLVFGRVMFRNTRTVDLSMAATGADIVWKPPTTAGNEGLGSTLLAVGPSRGIAPFILVSAPGAKVTHLFSDLKPAIPPATTRQIDSAAADHPTFTGAAVTAMAAGALDEAPDSGKPLDIALADPSYYDTTTDTAKTRGRVYLFADVDPTGTAAIDVGAAKPTITGTSQNSQLGTALLIADTSGGGEDLLVGAPGDGEGGTGTVHLFKHGTGLLLPLTLSTTNTDTTVPIKGYEPGGLFGSSLASTRAGSTSAVGLRLVVGAPNVSRPNNRIAAGAAYLYNADIGRTFRIFEQVYGKEAGDALGSTVAGGQLNASARQTSHDQIGDLVTAAPNARGTDASTGVVYVRYGQ